MNRPIFGLQLFPYDIRDEGLARVLGLATSAARATTLVPAVSYIEERQPQPVGVLPHNPMHSAYTTSPGFYFEPDWDLYPAGLRPARSSEEAGGRELAELREACVEEGIGFVPWLQLLAGGFSSTGDSPWVVNACGQSVPGWLCPRKDIVRKYVAAAVRDVVRRFQPEAVFVDRLRYPEWGAHGINDACVCFCRECQQAARAQGLDLKALQTPLNRAVDALLRAGETGLRPGLPDAVATVLPLLAGHREWLHWLHFRAEGVTGCVEAAARAARPDSALWLDVWPPTYGGLLGQDLPELARHADLLKSFAYHRLAGGADVAGYIRAIGHSPEARQDLYREYLRIFGLPGPDRFEHFEDGGLAVSFVTEETARTVRLSSPVPACAGVQIFQVGPQGVREALDAARAGHPAGYMLYAYGWASEDELQAAGEWWERRGQGGRAS